jgi:hypothetical protein
MLTELPLGHMVLVILAGPAGTSTLTDTSIEHSHVNSMPTGGAGLKDKAGEMSSSNIRALIQVSAC